VHAAIAKRVETLGLGLSAAINAVGAVLHGREVIDPRDVLSLAVTTDQQQDENGR
jgi:hypothetical protein